LRRFGGRHGAIIPSVAPVTGTARAAERRTQRVPPTVLVLGAVSSVQVGAALGKTLFDELGAGGTVFLRVLFAALVLALVWPPRLRGHGSRDLGLAVVYGIALAGMNLAFYSSIDRIPLGIAVTFEFVGPLGVAVVGSRRTLDLLWVGLAAAGILLLSDFGSGDLDALGVGLALLAGSFWAAYILLSVRVGKAFPGGSGLALAMLVATVPLAPVGIAQAGSELLVPGALLVAAGVGILSSAIPYTLEIEALRRMPTGVFGVLMSLEPAVAAIAGYVVLGEGLVTREIAAVALVVAASAGAASGATVAPRDA
jgi:inner membrane transporter RhtA